MITISDGQDSAGKQSTGGGQMPDAKRALQLLAWLIAVRQGHRPS
jgi:hypothetical protein